MVSVPYQGKHAISSSQNFCLKLRVEREREKKKKKKKTKERNWEMVRDTTFGGSKKERIYISGF
jgi:hypothetical protein